jgi:hypothetical protein
MDLILQGLQGVMDLILQGLQGVMDLILQGLQGVMDLILQGLQGVMDLILVQGKGCRVYEQKGMLARVYGTYTGYGKYHLGHIFKRNVGRGGEGALKCRALLTPILKLLERL